MFVLYADKTQLTVREKEPITSGSVNVYPVRVEFSPDWDGLEKTIIFQAGCAEKPIPLTGGACTIPPEVLVTAGHFLAAGVCGKMGEDTVLPTIWATLGLIQEGAVPGDTPLQRAGRRPWRARGTTCPCPARRLTCDPEKRCCPLWSCPEVGERAEPRTTGR